MVELAAGVDVGSSIVVVIAVAIVVVVVILGLLLVVSVLVVVVGHGRGEAAKPPWPSTALLQAGVWHCQRSRRRRPEA